MNRIKRHDPSSRFIPPISQTLGLQNFENKLKNVFNKTFKTYNDQHQNLKHVNYENEESCHAKKYTTINEINNRKKVELSEIKNYIRHPTTKTVERKNTIHIKILDSHTNKNECIPLRHSTKEHNRYLNAFARNQVIEVLEAASVALGNKSHNIVT